MATWLPHFRLQFGGTLGDTTEEWSNTVRFKRSADRSPTGASEDLPASEIQEILRRLMDPAENRIGGGKPLPAWFGNQDAGIHVTATLNWAKLNFILNTGKQRDVQTHRVDFPRVNGGGQGQQPPWFQTAALTMRTGVTRGRAHSGRIFPPLYTVAPSGPYIPAVNATAAAFAFAVCLDEICAIFNSVDGAGAQVTYPVIASPATTLGPNPGPALLQPVNAVVMDRVHDVQHRRTNRIPRLEGVPHVVSAATGTP